MILKILQKFGQYTDNQLVDKYRKSKDVYYLALLFERYTEMTATMSMHYLKNEMDAQDATMECFELLVKDFPDAPISNFGGWYYTIVKNHLLRIKRKKQQSYTMDLTEGVHDRAEEDVLMRELFEERAKNREEVLEMAFGKLKPLQKECVELFYLKGHSYKQIADKMKLTENDVKSHIQNGKRKMKINLENSNINSNDEFA
jgi:RNA polymerase sigma-70 factor, ECF subfamily